MLWPACAVDVSLQVANVDALHALHSKATHTSRPQSEVVSTFSSLGERSTSHELGKADGVCRRYSAVSHCAFVDPAP